MDTKKIYSAVTQHYGSLATDATQLSRGYGTSVAQSFGYSEEELSSIPAESNLGLSCGNPLAMASIREGETVVDLGSGGGFDVFLAAKKVGPTGRAIGIDMNKDMLALAEKNKVGAGATNVEFVEGMITDIPLTSGTADVVLSNCVVNLVPEDEKQLVFNEVFRVLKPGGRLAISDILAKKPLSEKLRRCAAAYVGCIAGASLVEQYQTYLREAGFSDVLIKDANADLNVYLDTLPDGTKKAKNGGTSSSNDSTCGAPTPSANQGGCCGSKDIGPSGESEAASESTTAAQADLAKMAAEIGDIDLNEWIGSYKIFAVKPLEG
ncbi:ubiE/COQ5 methyltransferase [Sodiomyces alkalinus F11]|uniref:Arsenite methyltransferase n=1 Tax=Sodiomyces alkalinus (strain CBS 110278 / VKM F-3762 / F11) TaxID=1314773 RepID=A0A3N2Q5F1_SODAK|nr:ubiE/COQ5 methyltransferase [Sodiomyces alkalinus F11]ROT41982.1 ubiE/COQ5 methyltransferase [Sodiomyces alkalinus F11]